MYAARSTIAYALLACLVSACGSESPTTPRLEDKDAAGCEPGETPIDSGSTCQAAGVSPDGCAPGFVVASGAAPVSSGCVPVLPADPCPKGLVAIPGEETCRVLAPCGDGRWGEIPVDGTTQYVDGSYAGGGSDGTEAKPWTKIQDAVDAAAPGAIVAVTDGTYAEDVEITSRPVRLWGRCPERVEIAGTGAKPAAIFIVYAASSGTEVHALAVTGAFGGVGVSGADASIDRLWIHDLESYGIYLAADLGPVSAEVTGTLVESARNVGIRVVGATATIEGTTVRDTRSTSDGFVGRGIAVEDHVPKGIRSDATLRAMVIERNREVGLFYAGSNGNVVGSVVRDTLERPSDGLHGRGIGIEDNVDSGERASVVVDGCLVERSREIGVFVGGADATIQGTTVRDTIEQVAGMVGGRGVDVELAGDTGARSTATLAWSIVEGSADTGVAVFESDLTLTSSRVSTTRPAGGLFGDGLTAVGAGSATLVVEHARVESSARAGITSFGAAVTLSGTALECNTIQLDAETWNASKPVFDDLGGNACACDGVVSDCTLLSATLQPPAPLD